MKVVDVQIHLIGSVVRANVRGTLTAEGMVEVNQLIADKMSAQYPYILVDLSEVTALPKGLRTISDAADKLLHHPDFAGAVIYISTNSLLNKLLQFFSSMVSQLVGRPIYIAESLQEIDKQFSRLGVATNFAS